MNLIRAALIALLLFPIAALAWHDTGHMVVAEIAYRRLTPAVREKLDALLMIGGDEKTRTFVTASCWADDYKNDKDRQWHYIDRFFRADGKPSKNFAEEENAVFAILRSIRLLKDVKAPELDRANALRYMIHIVGDMHQPLHCVARETDVFPNGDRGGNDFKVIAPPGMEPSPRNLHFLWDMAAGKFITYKRPLSPEDYLKVQALANEAEKSYPEAGRAKEINILDPDDWAREGFELAKSRVYNLPENTVPSESYLKGCRDLSMRRVALAGYRLAALLNRILS